MTTWDDVLTQRDKQVFALSGYGKRAGFGQRPAILVIDVNYNFVGDKPEPILESVKRFRNSCGAEGWEGVHRIRELLIEARKSIFRSFTRSGTMIGPTQSSLDAGKQKTAARAKT